MIYPLRDWKTLPRGYLFGQPTSYNAHHIGVDLVCDVGTKVYAPVAGIASSSIGPEAGRQIQLKADGKILRFLHLSVVVKTGAVNEGDLIGLTGNTGTNTTGPHLHFDISKNNLDLNNFANFVDPELYLRVHMEMQITGVNYTDGFDLNDQVLKYSRSRISTKIDFMDSPISVPSGMITQDQAYTLADQLNPKTKYLILCYQGNATSTFLATYYYPKLNICISTVPLGSSPRNVAFEMAHALQYWYNENRGSNPPVQVEDSNFPSDELFYRKYETIMPYFDLLKGLNTQKLMTKKDVEMLQALEGYKDDAGAVYWTGKPLSEYLKARLQDKENQIKNLLQ